MWRCKGIRIRGWEVVGDRMQLKIDNTVCGLMWGVWFARVVEEGVISLHMDLMEFCTHYPV